MHLHIVHAIATQVFYTCFEVVGQAGIVGFGRFLLLYRGLLVRGRGCLFLNRIDRWVSGFSFGSALCYKVISLLLPGILLLYPVALLHPLKDGPQVRSGPGIGFVLPPRSMWLLFWLNLLSSFFGLVSFGHSWVAL